MPQWADYNKVLGYYKRHCNCVDEHDHLPVVNNFVCAGYPASIRESKTKISVSVYDGKDRIALFIFDKKKCGICANWSAVWRRYRGLGIGYKVYRKVINYYGHLHSSETLTGETGYGSFNLYQKLSKSKCFKSYIYDTKTKDYTEVSHFDKSHMRYFKDRLCISE